ncbi:flagellin N-terminal helical domain-containing protein [Pseudobutyrivibrio sp.]|uniref:flagellin N-terminal helical domain-containing protein n=1 Tax=Pseudobutyrivibrio sp. TaxID=2014367 RepID=UPI001B62C16E|nr:flagellin [Pseudobutyrivibrio sp.]MBP3262328.1 flagellar hook protein [Pseudobutyrivibrio sp.]
MVVQHNMQAANASRMLGITTNAQSKSTEKLSSGFRINRAADDAAGLSISEKMRKQIRGLDQASTNASDGISAVQTAEGALTEVHSMLQRMNELAVQAANGTNSESDRTSIQDEIEQLTTEIDRVAETTKFNETYLLKGYYGTKNVKIAAHDAGLDGTLTQNATKATFTMQALAMGDKVTIGGTTYEIGADTLEHAKQVIKLPEEANAPGAVVTIDGKSYTFDTYTDVTQSKISYSKLSAFANNGSTITYNGISATIFSDNEPGTDGIDDKNRLLITANKAYEMIATELKAASSIGADSPVTINASNIKLEGTAITAESVNNKLESDLTTSGKHHNVTFTFDKQDVEIANELTFNLHVGSDADMTNKIGVTIESMSAAALGIQGLNVSDATGKAATYAIDSIADALAKVSAQRSSLGAVQNRLEHSIANLDNVVENTDAAESRIRDTDMADEMVTYSKNNILAQAGQSMLAQANQATQGVLSILQ